LVKCKPGFLETLFHTQSYKLKLEAEHIIKESINNLTDLSKDTAIFMHHIDILLMDLTLKLQHLNHGIPNNLSKKLVHKIDHSTSHIQPIKMVKIEKKIWFSIS
jgi:hypothetical protein